EGALPPPLWPRSGQGGGWEGVLFGAPGKKHPSPALPFASGEREGDKRRRKGGNERVLLPLPFGRAADKGEAGRGCFPRRPAKSTPPQPSPSPPAKGRELCPLPFGRAADKGEAGR